jgi:hypothetical protein
VRRRSALDAPAESEATCRCRSIAAPGYRWRLYGQERYEATYGRLCAHVGAEVMARADGRYHQWQPGEEAYVLAAIGGA